MTQAPEMFSFDYPYSLINNENGTYTLKAHGIAVASYSVDSWGDDHACVEAAWHHAYGADDATRITDLEARAEKAEALLARAEKAEAELAKLFDPNAVHVSMLAGTVAKPSWEQIRHIYAAEVAALPHETERNG